MKYEDSEKILSQIKKEQKIPQIIILISTDIYQSDIFFTEYKKYIHTLYDGVEIISLNGLEATSSQFHAELTTIPLFSANRFLLIRHSDTLFKNIITNNVIFKYFERDFKQIPTCTRILIHIESDLSKSYDFLKNISTIVETRVLYEKDIFALIERKAQDIGKEIHRDTINLLINKCAFDSKQILKTFDQIALYSMQSKIITKDDINMICLDIEGDLYFSILDSIAEKKINRCLQKINQHKFTDASLLLPGIIKIFTDAFRYNIFKNLNLDVQLIRKKMGWDTGQVFINKKNESRLLSTIKFYSLSNINIILKKLKDLDKQIKMEAPNKHKTLLIMFITSLE